MATSPTTWVSPTVVVPKSHDPNITQQSVNMRQAKQAILREEHVPPTLDDPIATLTGASVSSNLDPNDGYHQLVLNEDVRHITTFATHLGLYLYKRLNFEKNAAAELFQNTLRQLLTEITTVINFSDDILVLGKTKRA